MGSVSGVDVSYFFPGSAYLTQSLKQNQLCKGGLVANYEVVLGCDAYNLILGLRSRVFTDEMIHVLV